MKTVTTVPRWLSLMITLAVCISGLVCTRLALADPVTVIREYTHRASDADSKLSCRAIALEQVKRLLLEELGTYLISHTEIVNASLNRDEVVTYTAGAVVTIIIEERWNGEDYFIKAKVSADADEVARSIAAMRDDRDKKAELEQLRAQAAESLKEIDRLRKELELAKSAGKTGTSTEITSIRENYNREVSLLTAKNYVDEGIRLRKTGALEEAINAFGKAVDGAPGWSRPYSTRGAAFLLVSQPQRARQDLEQALRLNPGDMTTACLYGVALLKLGNREQAISEFKRVTAAAPHDTVTSTNIGGMLVNNGMYRDALAFLTNSIDQRPRDNGRAFFLRAQAYSHLGDRQKAMRDLKNAASHGNRKARELLKR